MKITKEDLLLKKACSEGLEWYLGKGLDNIEWDLADEFEAENDTEFNYLTWFVRKFKISLNLINLKSGSWEKVEYDKNGSLTYYEGSNGFWKRWKYDEAGNQTYFEDSKGYWEKSEYDEAGKELGCESGRKEVRK